MADRHDSFTHMLWYFLTSFIGGERVCPQLHNQALPKPPFYMCGKATHLFQPICLSPVFPSWINACSPVRSSQSPEQRIRYQILKRPPNLGGFELKRQKNNFVMLHSGWMSMHAEFSRKRCSQQQLVVEGAVSVEHSESPFAYIHLSVGG